MAPQTLGNYVPTNFPNISDPSALGKHTTGEFSKISNAVSLTNQALADGVAATAANTASIVTNTTNIATLTTSEATDAANIVTINTTLAALGTAATKNVGTAVGNVVQMAAGPKLPAVDGSALTGIPFPAVASKSDQQTGTSTTTVVTPAHAGDHDGSVKAWVEFNNVAGVITINASFNVASVVRTGTGVCTVTFTTPFATAAYATISTIGGPTSGGLNVATSTNSQAAGSVSVNAFTAGSALDRGMAVVCFGRQ